ncbi:MAG: hypothetical protein AMJ63_17120 [Myxococcales bacterium SG8_38_1]|jgi:hypothetical protein|nr:MAG: hypothetical protein AMJ63_17120 [Myxococcales bacterium SG8_38_1]
MRRDRKLPTASADRLTLGLPLAATVRAASGGWAPIYDAVPPSILGGCIAWFCFGIRMADQP